MEYRGWTNYETWAVNVYFGDSFSEMYSSECPSPGDVEEYVKSTLSEMKSSLERDFVNNSMTRVDWNVLSERYAPEELLVDEF